jgi:hypothetical protein
MKYIVEIDENGNRFWRNFKTEKFHRENGPACEYVDGTKIWYLNGQVHREDGPAIEMADGAKEWYLNGINHTEEEFNKKTKNPCKIDGEIVEIKGIKYRLTKV